MSYWLVPPAAVQDDGSSHRGQSFQQLDGQAGQRRVVLVVNVLGQHHDEVVAVAAVLSEGLLQRGHHVRGRLQPDDVVGDREGQLDCLDEDEARALAATAGRRSGRENQEDSDKFNFQTSKRQIVCET